MFPVFPRRCFPVCSQSKSPRLNMFPLFPVGFHTRVHAESQPHIYDDYYLAGNSGNTGNNA